MVRVGLGLGSEKEGRGEILFIFQTAGLVLKGMIKAQETDDVKDTMTLEA